MKKNKPRWKNLDMWERLARRCKQNGASEDTVEHIREHGKQREIEKLVNEILVSWTENNKADAEMYLPYLLERRT